MILYLHDILPKPDMVDLQCSRMSLATFDQLLSILQSDFEWIGFKEYERLRLAKRLSKSHIALSFDDASLSLLGPLERLRELGRDCALMVATAPYLEHDLGLLPHQLVEAYYRDLSLDFADLKKTKKELKKRARREGARVYLEFARAHEDWEGLLLRTKADLRFQFLPESRLREFGEYHTLIHHGHFHSPLGNAQSGEVVNDQLLNDHYFQTTSYALPFGDLEGALPEQLLKYSSVYGTEGPYEDSRVILRQSAQSFLEHF